MRGARRGTKDAAPKEASKGGGPRLDARRGSLSSARVAKGTPQAASLKGFLGKRAIGGRGRRGRGPGHLARVLLLCLGASFLWRSYKLFADAPVDADGRPSEAQAAAGGTLLFVGALAFVLAGFETWRSRAVADSSLRQALAKGRAASARRAKAA